MREELEGMESTANNANSLLMMAREDKRLLKAELEEKETAIATLQPQLKETKNDLATCETQLQQALEPVSPPVVAGGETESTEILQDEIPLGVRQRLIEFVGERKSQAKDTRNWFQANKMIAELEMILSTIE